MSCEKVKDKFNKLSIKTSIYKFIFDLGNNTEKIFESMEEDEEDEENLNQIIFFIKKYTNFLKDFDPIQLLEKKTVRKNSAGWHRFCVLLEC